jgi:hypothetical protein
MYMRMRLFTMSFLNIHICIGMHHVFTNCIRKIIKVMQLLSIIKILGNEFLVPIFFLALFGCLLELI